MNPISPVLFNTERLYARELSPEDKASVFEFACDTESWRYMPSGPMSEEQAYAFLERSLADQIAVRRSRYALALCLKETDEFVGVITLKTDPVQLDGNIGYVIINRFQHKGYASEAVPGMLRFGFLGLDLHRIYARCDDRNIASIRVLESAGLRREGHFINSLRKIVRGVDCWNSIYIYAMLQKELLTRLPDGSHSASAQDRT